MALEKWECQEISMKSETELNNFVDELVEVMKQLKKDHHLKNYFFNRYIMPNCLIKLGLVDADADVKTALNTLLIKHNLTNNVKPYDCEIWTVPANNGVSIEKIKCVSCELYEIVKENFKPKLSKEQAYFLIHFLMNQLGYTYSEELWVHQNLGTAIINQLKRKP